MGIVLSNEKFKLVAKIILVILLIFLAQKYLFIPLVNSEAAVKFIESTGKWGYLIIIGYTIISHVFAPIAGSPGVILGVSLYGLRTGVTLLYIASLISATINFYIARKYGRGIVIKLVGKKAMKSIDDFTKIKGRKVLVLSRLFGFAFFDLISYAGGLTLVKFKHYFMITAVCALFVNTMIYLLFQDLDLRSEKGSTIWLSSVFLVAVIFGLVLRKYLHKQKHPSR